MEPSAVIVCVERVCFSSRKVVVVRSSRLRNNFSKAEKQLRVQIRRSALYQFSKD